MARPTRWSTASSSTCSFTSRGEGAPLAAVVTLPQVLGPLVTSSLTLEHQLARTDGQNPVKPQGYDLHPVQPAVTPPRPQCQRVSAYLPHRKRHEPEQPLEGENGQVVQETGRSFLGFKCQLCLSRTGAQGGEDCLV